MEFIAEDQLASFLGGSLPYDPEKDEAEGEEEDEEEKEEEMKEGTKDAMSN